MHRILHGRNTSFEPQSLSLGEFCGVENTRVGHTCVASQPWEVFGVPCMQMVGALFSMKVLESGRE